MQRQSYGWFGRLFEVFGKKKRRQEPVAVQPEQAPGAWLPTTSGDGNGVGSDGAMSAAREVSRETSALGASTPTPALQAAAHEPEVSYGGADAASAPARREESTVNGPLDSGAARVGEPTPLRDSESGDGLDARTGSAETTAGSVSTGAAGTDALAVTRLGSEDRGTTAPRTASVSRETNAGTPAEHGLGGDASGAPSEMTAPSSGDAASPEISAEGSGRRSPSAPMADSAATSASADAAPPGDLVAGLEQPGTPASAVVQKRVRVRSAPRVASTGDHDELQRAELVDSLPDADEDTPLMVQIQTDARRRIELRGRKFPRPTSTRVITVANQKGGVGKTTTTVNLAAALAQAGLNVLVLDNDPQGNASTALGVDHRAGTPSIYEVLVEGAPMADAVQSCPDVPNLLCVPATIDLSGAEIELVSMVARETRLRSALETYLAGRVAAGQDPIDYVFVDCPPSLGLLTVNAFVVGREVLIPIQCEYYALEGLSQLLKTIQLIQAHLNPDLHVSTILLTMYDSRTNLAQQVAQEVRDHFPETTLKTSVPRSVRISEAPSYGQTVMTYDAGSTGALAYLEAARELAERGGAGSGVEAAGGIAAAGALAGAAAHGLQATQALQAAHGVEPDGTSLDQTHDSSVGAIAVALQEEL